MINNKNKKIIKLIKIIIIKMKQCLKYFFYLHVYIYSIPAEVK